MTNPWFKFYPQDWLGEKALRFCSPASKGLWIDMICVMHQSGGYLLNNGQPVTDRMLVALTGIDESTIALLKGELETNGVFSVNNKGVIYSRRMVEDIARAKKLQKNGKFGGNPSLCKDKEKEPLVNQPDNYLDKPRSQKPDKKDRELVFEGRVIRLTSPDCEKVQNITGLDDETFQQWVVEKDKYYATLPKAGQANWWHMLNNAAKQVRV